MMEAKLRQMEQSKPITYSSSSTTPSSSFSHPSLPTKPLPSFPNSNHHRSRGGPSHSQIRPRTKMKTPLPSLPIPPPSSDSKSSSLSLISQLYATESDPDSRSERHLMGQHKSTMSGLVGVRIGKSKDRASSTEKAQPLE